MARDNFHRIQESFRQVTRPPLRIPKRARASRLRPRTTYMLADGAHRLLAMEYNRPSAAWVCTVRSPTGQDYHCWEDELLERLPNRPPVMTQLDLLSFRKA